MIKRLFYIGIPILCFIALILYLNGYNEYNPSDFELRTFFSIFNQNMATVSNLKISSIDWRVGYVSYVVKANQVGGGVVDVLVGLVNFLINLFNTLVMAFNVVIYAINLVVLLFGFVVALALSLTQWIANTGVQPSIF